MNWEGIRLRGKGIAHGAISIVNAIASGKGGALGIRLKVEVDVELFEGRGISVKILDADGENPNLVKKCVEKVLQKFSINHLGARVITKSEIPIAKGLKSSSAISNATVLATCAALGKDLDDLDLIRLGVDASIEAGVSITGAFDDASASYFGGFVLTENYSRRIIKLEPSPEHLQVVIYVPEMKLYTKDVNRSNLEKLSHLVDEVFKLAEKGEYWKALTLNGLIYSAALGFSPQPAIDALMNGALAAGLSGKGPAIAAVCEEGTAEIVASSWSKLQGKVIKTTVNNSKAYGVRI
ncbi:MAG: shikimate kinase [Nitrososphaerota archaeon]|nr:shikimate kinase [Nitrososphaerales archaeon]MDW8044166.1 shikimate kinase [Nitrososphaerota archaeon]